MPKYNGNEVRWLIAEAIQQLSEEADEAVKDERVREYLDFCGSFHQYSFGNRIWLMHQARQKEIVPTRFAGTKTWNGLNRIVKKGSEAFWVLAPKQKKVVREVPVKDASTGEILYEPDSGEPFTDEEVVQRTFFDPVWVFDLSQTQVMCDRETGEPLADGYRTLDWAIAAQGDAEELVPLVRKLADTVKFLVEMLEVEGSALGYTDYQKIVVREDLDAPTKVEVMLHEIAHNVLDHFHREVGRETREAEAATTAYVVAKWLSLEPGGSKYLALWGQDSKAIMACMDRALDASGKMIQDLVRISQQEDIPAAEDPRADEGIPETSEDEEIEPQEETASTSEPAPVEEAREEEAAEEFVADEETTSATDTESCEDEGSFIYDGFICKGAADSGEEETEEEPADETASQQPSPQEEEGPEKLSFVDVGKKELKGLIDTAALFTDPKGDLEILSSIRFETYGASLKARATDLINTVEAWIPCTCDGDLSFVVPAKELKGILKRLGDNIRISMTNKSEDVTITDFEVDMQIRTQLLEDFPILPSYNLDFIADHDFRDFQEITKRVSVAMSKDEKRPTLCSLLLSYKDGNMVATDSYRMAVYEAGWEGREGAEMLLDSKVVKEIQKLKQKGSVGVFYDAGNNVVQLKLDDLAITSKCCEGKYPKYSTFIEDGKGNPIRVRVSADDFAESVAKVDFGNVTLSVDGQDLRMSSEDRESGVKATGKLNVVVSVESDEEAYNKPLSIVFNPAFLSDVGSIFEKEPLDIRFREPLKPAMFSQGKMRYVIMPIRL